jgi:hypothetical protein
MFISEYHKKTDRSDFPDGDKVTEYIISKKNRTYLTHILVSHFREYTNRYGVSIFGTVSTSVEVATENYLSLISPHIKKITFKDNLDYLSFCNSHIMLDIIASIEKNPPKEVIDPLWTQKGPEYSRKLINYNKNPGYVWAMKKGCNGPTMQDRFRNNSYWARPNHHQ